MEIEKYQTNIELVKKLKASDKSFYEKTIFQRETEKIALMRQIMNLEDELISIKNNNFNNENNLGYIKTDESLKIKENVTLIFIKSLGMIEEKIVSLGKEVNNCNIKVCSLIESCTMMKEDKIMIDIMLVNLISLKESIDEMIENINIFERGTEAYEHFMKHLENITKDTHMDFHLYEMNIIDKNKFIQNLYKYFEKLEIQFNVSQFKKICENSFLLMKNNEFLEMSDFFHLFSKKIQEMINSELHHFDHKNVVNNEVIKN